jgi:hypothetical protein
MRRIFRPICVGGLVLGAICIFGQVKPATGNLSSNLRFNVVKDDNNKPVRNAGVVLHPVGKNGKQSKGGLELKTDNEGNASMEGVPYGLLRVQVLAPGMQSFGDDYDINQPQMEIKIRLKRPTDQLTTYDKPKDKPSTAPPAAPPAEPKPN